jgi:hypothetical protein
MSRWIGTERGYVNLDHAIEAECMTRTEPHVGREYFLRLKMVNGEIVTTEGRGIEPNYRNMLATVIPSQPGQEAVLVQWDDDGRPTEVETCRVPVLGWQLDIDDLNSDPVPILPEASWSNTRTILIVLPDGRLYGDGYHDTLEKACATVLRRVQRDWDRKHNPTPIVNTER